MMENNLSSLPQGWEVVSLSKVVKINSGIALPSIFKDKEHFHGGEIPFYKVAQMNNHHSLMTTAELYFSEVIAQKEKIKIFPKGSILIPKRGGAILTNKKRMMTVDASYDSNIMGLKAINKVLSDEFLFAFLESIDLANFVDTTTIPQINNKHIDMMDIPLPPLEEQRRIVGVLDGLFAKIDASIALLDESIASASSLMPSALNEVFEELGEKWEKKRLEECTFFQNGYAFKSQDFSETQKTFQVIRIGNVLDLNKNPVYIDEQKELERFRLYENDIVISMTGTRQKQDYLFVSLIQKAKYYLNQRVGKITAKSNSVSKFIFYYLQSRHFREKIFEFETGTVNQGNISGKDIMNMLIPLPPLGIQTQTVVYLDALHVKADALKKAQEKKKEALLALKASLLESAFKGEL